MRARELPAGRRSYVNRTGGSTGEPVEFWQDTHYWDVVVATRINHFERFGKKIGELEMKVWGSDRDIVHDTSRWQGKLQSFLYNRRIRTCSGLSGDGIRAIIEEINRYKPRNVWAYVDGMYTIADYVLRCGFKVHAPSAIFIGGGTLLPRMRDVIQEAFGAPVIGVSEATARLHIEHPPADETHPQTAHLGALVGAKERCVAAASLGSASYLRPGSRGRGAPATLQQSVRPRILRAASSVCRSVSAALLRFPR